jgi:phage-related holin
MPVKTMITTKLLVLVSFILAYLAPIGADLLGIGVLISIDLILGLVAARKLKVKISSKKLSQTIVKSLTYMLLIIAAFVINKTLVEWLPMVQVTLAFLAITEFTSIAENFQKITGLPFVKYIKEQLGRYMKKHSDE